MNRLFTPPNSGHLGIALLALVAKAVLGGFPILGGIISFALTLVIFYNLARVAMNLIRPATA